MFGKVVVDDQRMFAVIPEVLADGGAGKWRQVLHGCCIARGGCHHDAVFHRVVFFECLNDAGHSGTFLADGDIDAKDVEALLVDDRIDSNGGLAGLPVADDQLTLSSADGDHGVDGFDARLQRLAHRLPCIHPGRDNLDAGRKRRLDRPFAIDRLPDCIYHTTDQGFADRNLRNTSRALDRIAFLHPNVIAHEYGADIIFFKVQRDSIEAAGELKHFTGHGSVKAIDLGNPVSDLND